MPILTATGISKAYGTRTLFADVDLTIARGEHVAICGQNGSGKSTLGRILAMVEAPDTGSIALRRGATVACLEQNPTLAPEQSALDVVREGLGPWLAATRAHAEVSKTIERGAGDLTRELADQARYASEIERLGGWHRDREAEKMLRAVGIEHPDRPASTMSGGEQRRVALARTLTEKSELLVLDEPTNHLDIETVEWLEVHLDSLADTAVVLISHDRYLIERFATRTIEVDDGRIYTTAGAYESYLHARAERLAHEARIEQNRKNLLRRELEWLSRQPKARTTKQKARIGRAEELKRGGPQTRDRTLDLRVAGTKFVPSTLVELSHVDLGLDSVLVRDLSLVLQAGERMGIVGKNGCGKTTLLRMLAGDIEARSGDVRRSPKTKIAYFDQHRSVLEDDKSIVENVAQERSHLVIGGQPIDARAYLERFLFDSRDLKTKVSALSGGERARVALAKLLASETNLLLLDEPTNDLDMVMLGALEEVVSEFAGAVVVVTHDRYFLDRTATSILAFDGTDTLVRYAGGYSDYVAQRPARSPSAEERKTETVPPASAIPSHSAPATKKKLTYAEKLELEAIVGEIAELEGQVAVLEAELSDPSFYTSAGDEVRTKTSALEKARETLETKLERWMELESRVSD